MSLLSYGNTRLKRAYDRAPVQVQTAVVTAYGWRHRRQVNGAHYRRYVHLLQQTQWYSSERLGAYQSDKLRAFIGHACATSPYWREVFATRGLTPSDVQTPGDLAQLPILEKETVRAQIDRLASSAYAGRRPQTVAVHTSGTTGKALHLRLTKECWQRDYAFRDQQRSWSGALPGDPVVTFAGHPVVPSGLLRPPYCRYNRPERQLIFSSQHLGPATAPDYAREVRRFRPTLIHGYPSTIYLFALYLQDAGIRDIRPRAVYTHSETLLDHQRAVIENAMGCKVYNWYGSSEMVGNIVECERGKLHVRQEHSVLELLTLDGRPARPGDVAELIGTGFGNYATPLIRYRLGDTVLVGDGECTCGRAGPIVKSVIGRIEDIVVTPDGRHVGRLDHVFKDALNVREAQLRQDEVGSLTVRLVTRPRFGERDRNMIEGELRTRLGPAIRLDYQMVSAIPREANGKFRFVVSKVPIRMGETIIDQSQEGRT